MENFWTRSKFLRSLLRYHYISIFFEIFDRLEESVLNFFILIKKFKKISYFFFILFITFLFTISAKFAGSILVILILYIALGAYIEDFPIWIPVKFGLSSVQVHKEFLFINSLWKTKKKKVVKLF